MFTVGQNFILGHSHGKVKKAPMKAGNNTGASGKIDYRKQAKTPWKARKEQQRSMICLHGRYRKTLWEQKKTSWEAGKYTLVSRVKNHGKMEMTPL